MSGESAPKPRLVLCPKCRQLLPESPDYDVYKCGGCGTILQAKKRRSRAVNSESSSLQTDATPTNASNPVSDDRQCNNGEKLASTQENGLGEKATSTSSERCSSDENDSECNGEQLVTPRENGIREKVTGSSSGECSSEGNGGRGQIESGECDGEKLVTSQENGLKAKVAGSSEGIVGRGQIENGECNVKKLVTSLENGLREKVTDSSSGECSLNGNGGRDQIENGKFNGDQLVTFQENALIAKASSSSTGESSLNGNGGRDQIENGECNGEQLVTSQENGLKEKATGSFSAECSSEENGGSDQIENGGCNEEQLVTSHENFLRAKATSSSSGEYFLKGNGGGGQIENGECNREQFMSALDIESVNDEKSAVVGVKSEVDIAESDIAVPEELSNGNLLLEGAEHEILSGSDGDEVNHHKLAPIGVSPEADIDGARKAESEELNHGKLLFEGTEELNMCASDREDPKNGQSTLVGAKSAVDTTGNVSSTAQRLNAENFASEKESISHASPCNEGTSSDHVSSPRNVHHRFDLARSVDTFDHTEAINPSLGALSKSPTTRSSHAYDGSVSSNDGMDERIPNHHLYSFENTYTVADGVSEGESRKGKGKGLVHNMSSGDLETQHQSYFPNRRNHINEGPETTRHSHANWMRAKKDEFPSKIPLPRSGSESGYERGSPSSQLHDELYGASSYLSPDSFEDPDLEKMKLLRMVYKLQEQLNRTSYANGETNGRLSNEIHVSAYQSHDFHEGRFFRDLDPPRRDGRYSHGINSHQRHNFSRIPYLPEPRSSPNHVEHPGFHCYPQEWQCSGEFPPHVLYQHDELYRPHPGHNCCSSHHSYPSSPQWFTTSKPVHGRETKSCDQRVRAPEMRNYFREKPSLTRRHCRPVAGGAPFVTCYKCSKLLQLPADFLLFKRVCSELKCGECQEVLKFSLQNRSHIVSYAPNGLGPKSSDLNDQNEMIDGSHPHSESHANHCHSSNADPISYSDDYDNSVVKSSSSEGEPVSVTPSHHLHDNPSVSPGNFEPTAENDKKASRGPSTSKPPVHSSNMSSATALPKSSTLHQLMGYSSPSLVLRGFPSSVQGEEPRPNGENDLSHNSQQSSSDMH